MPKWNFSEVLLFGYFDFLKDDYMNISSGSVLMPSSIKTYTILLGMAFLTACASPVKLFSSDTVTEIFYKDGSAAYVASCKTVNWGPCLERAGIVCRNVGYTVLEKNSQTSYGEPNKEIVFACNGKPEVQPKPAASESNHRTFSGD